MGLNELKRLIERYRNKNTVNNRAQNELQNLLLFFNCWKHFFYKLLTRWQQTALDTVSLKFSFFLILLNKMKFIWIGQVFGHDRALYVCLCVVFQWNFPELSKSILAERIIFFDHFFSVLNSKWLVFGEIISKWWMSEMHVCRLI